MERGIEVILSGRTVMRPGNGGETCAAVGTAYRWSRHQRGIADPAWRFPGLAIQRGARRALRWLGIVAILFAAGAASAAKLTVPADRPIRVTADSASNDPDTNITEFRGHFSLSGTDWPLEGEQATVYGPIEKPERVVLRGSPARIWVRRHGRDRDVSAEADEIDYLPDQDILRLQGNVSLTESSGRHVSSDGFEYDLKTDKMRSIGPIRIQAQPDKAPAAPPPAEPAAGTR